MYNDTVDPLLAWDEETLRAEALQTGFVEAKTELLEMRRRILLPERTLGRWMDTSDSGSYASRLLRHGATAEMVEGLRRTLLPLVGREANFASRTALLTARK